MKQTLSRFGTVRARRLTARAGLLLSLTVLSACDLAPHYDPPHYVVPASWHGQGPFKDAVPSTVALKPDWWTLFADTTLNGLEQEALANNADLQAAAERFRSRAPLSWRRAPICCRIWAWRLARATTKARRIACSATKAL